VTFRAIVGVLYSLASETADELLRLRYAMRERGIGCHRDVISLSTEMRHCLKIPANVSRDASMLRRCCGGGGGGGGGGDTRHRKSRHRVWRSSPGAGHDREKEEKEKKRKRKKKRNRKREGKREKKKRKRRKKGMSLRRAVARVVANHQRRALLSALIRITKREYKAYATRLNVITRR